MSIVRVEVNPASPANLRKFSKMLSDMADAIDGGPDAASVAAVDGGVVGPREIWLSPSCEDATGEGRTWADSNVWGDGCDEEGCAAKPTRYVRADLATPTQSSVDGDAKLREALEREERDTLPFELGKTYQTQEGKSVTIIAVSDQRGYECVQGDDPSENSPTGVWRYNRAYDRGRVTGSAFDMSDPRNLVPESAALRSRAAMSPHKDEQRSE